MAGFVLHYLDTEGVLFSRSFAHYRDAYPAIQSYFQPAVFDLSAFKKERTFLQDIRKHFISRDFKYAVTTASAIWFLLSTSWPNLGFLMFIILLLAGGAGRLGVNGLMAVTAFTTLVVGPNLLLFFSYYRYAKDKILILSKGNDVFCYGNAFSPVCYDKKSIRQLTSVRIRGSFRSPVSGFAVLKIEFEDGSAIRIPDIFVGYIDLEGKFPGLKMIAESGYPFING